MEDKEIISLFFERSEQAINELKIKYGGAVRKTLRNILDNEQDAEECFNDTLLHIWNAVPPKNPEFLGAYVCRTARNIALNRFISDNAVKRSRRFDESIEEFETVLRSGENVEEGHEAKELAGHISVFLKKQPYADRFIFMRRYWYADGITEISRKTGISSKNVSLRLFRVRERLKKYLRKEGLL